MEYRYIENGDNAVYINGELVISRENLLKAIRFCNDAIRTLDEQTKQFDCKALSENL